MHGRIAAFWSRRGLKIEYPSTILADKSALKDSSHLEYSYFLRKMLMKIFKSFGCYVESKVLNLAYFTVVNERNPKTNCFLLIKGTN